MSRVTRTAELQALLLLDGGELKIRELWFDARDIPHDRRDVALIAGITPQFMIAEIVRAEGYSNDQQ